MSHFVRKSLMILIGGILLSRFSSAADINDNQLWSSFAVYRPVSRKIILHVGPQYKWGGNAQHHYLTRYDAGADFGVNNWLRPGFGFKRILKKISKPCRLLMLPMWMLFSSGQGIGCFLIFAIAANYVMLKAAR